MLPSRYFVDLTQPEIAAQFKTNPLVILPVGSIEQHGPHLPTGTDTLAANVIGHAVAERMDGLVLPSTPLGVTRSTANLQIKTTDFSLTSTAIGNVLVNEAGSGTRSVQAKAFNGFAGTVTLACAVVGAPTGVSCSVPASTTTSATGISFTTTVSATTAATAANYTVTVTGTNNGQQRTYSFTAQVKDFTLGLGAGAITIGQPPAGQSVSVTVPVTLTALNGFNTSTALACTGQPAGMTCAFAPASLIPTGGGINSTLTVTSASTVPMNVYSLQVKGTAGTLIHQQPLSVTTGGPNFTQAVTPATQNVTSGSSANYTVVYTPLAGMNQPITVGCGALPPGVSCTPNPPTVSPGTTPGNQSIVTLATTFGTTPAANSTVAITGNGIGITRSNNVTLSVRDFTVTTSTVTVATNVGSNVTGTFLIKGLNGFTGIVGLECEITEAPAGGGCTLSNANPAATAAGTSVTATITSNAATTPPGTYTVRVQGTNSSQSKVAQFTVNIKDFTLGTGTGAITIPQPPPGQSSSRTVPVTLTALNGYNSSTALSCTGQPAGMTCAFSPASGIPTIGGLHSTLTVTGARLGTSCSRHTRDDCPGDSAGHEGAPTQTGVSTCRQYLPFSPVSAILRVLIGGVSGLRRALASETGRRTSTDAGASSQGVSSGA